jgi:hypothetical protein
MITFGSLSFPSPDFNYRVDIDLPFDIVETDDMILYSADEGTKYDKRSCTISTVLTEEQMLDLNRLISNTSRGANIVLTLPANSGFFPFGPDKGDSGSFTVAARITSTGKIQENPFRYFAVQLQLTNIGSYPSYSLPTQVNEGTFTFGAVSCLRQPIGLFNPEQVYNVSLNLTENSSAEYVDRGALSDGAKTQMRITCNESKAAALLDYIVSTARISDISMVTPPYYYPFGRDHASPFTVQLTSNKLSVVHENYDRFSLDLSLNNKLRSETEIYQETIASGEELQETIATGDEIQEII